MLRSVVCVVLVLLSSSAWSKPSLPECSLPTLGNKLTTRVVEVLQDLKTSVANNYPNETDITETAYKLGYFTKVKGCDEPGVNLKANKAGYTLTLIVQKYDQCVAIEKSPLFGKNNIDVDITYLPLPKEKRCLKNPMNWVFFNKIPNANRIAFFIPATSTPLPTPPPSSKKGCEPLASSSYPSHRKRIERALQLIQAYASFTNKKLRAFKARGGQIMICDQREGSGFHDFSDSIWMSVPQMKTQSFEVLVRVLLEEIAHTDRKQTGWPHPQDFKRRQDFTTPNTQALVAMEAEGWIRAWTESENISSKSKYNIPLMTVSGSCVDYENSKRRETVAKHWRRLKKNWKQWDYQRKVQYTGLHCVAIYQAASGKSYKKYYLDMSKAIYEAHQQNDLVVIRGRPMVNEAP
ncbi:MAG: hypothetical protein MI976_02170 [Pseudomonadales bacterium]|nr:hypothetical protein [Pseudomonadales bacterium]